jgi:hypothetical protein
MKYFVTILICLSLSNLTPAQEAPHSLSFDTWFAEGVMRLDVVFSGTADETSYALSGVKKENYYSGPHSKLWNPLIMAITSL